MRSGIYMFYLIAGILFVVFILATVVLYEKDDLRSPEY